MEWSGTDLSSVFSQKRNLVSPRFLGMLRDLGRFNRLTQSIAAAGQERELQQSLGDFLRQHRFGDAFIDWYFLPMVACIWSCPKEQMLQFPVATMIRFCHNHGLNQVSDRPQWWTVKGGARHYVDKIVARVADKRLRTPVLGNHAPWRERRRDRRAPPAAANTSTASCWPPTATRRWRCCSDASAAERATLGAMRYHPNRAVLHTDTSVLPRNPRAWAAWNYDVRQRSVSAPKTMRSACTT